ncbi:reactive intermediate/imine deaminase [Reticulibacter mediterranei]|uniref:Reactive intermediate/imine deaminase n=1 Tax=Reticulibacter mediterranei TaxID=2778369 RepID=A0A8J3IPT5_9CHLR|nr:RidA family protein [Reticulibacter mediterranei]GHO97953.1 reactive intermediate/imine deaminase [Reticulibacter mediterranei]
MSAIVEHINPDDMHKNRAFTQVIAVSGPVKTIYVGGQDAVDAAGNVVGKGDVQQQAVQALENVQKALAAAGAGLEHVVRWNVYLVQGQPLAPGFAAFQRVWGQRPNPPTITMMYVAGLAHPDFLVEIDAIAVLPIAG